MYNATNSKYITGVNIDVKEKNPVINHAILIDHNPFLQTLYIASHKHAILMKIYY
jgi:hypothetical protein